MKRKLKKLMMIVLAFGMSLSTAFSASAGDGSIWIQGFLLAAAYGDYAQYVELGEYMTFHERDFNNGFANDEIFEPLFGDNLIYIRLAAENSQISGYSKRLSKNFDILVDILSGALEIEKKFFDGSENQESASNNVNWNDIEKEDVEAYYDVLKGYIEVACAIAIKENISVEFDLGLPDTAASLEEYLKSQLEICGFEDEVYSAIAECVKGIAIVDAVGDYLMENAYVIAEVDYIFPDSNTCFLKEYDVEGLSLEEINYGKNEIYARLGKKFSSKELQDYFDSKYWYTGIYEAEDFEENYEEALMNEFEKANVNFLTEVEYAMDPEGYLLDQ